MGMFLLYHRTLKACNLYFFFLILQGFMAKGLLETQKRLWNEHFQTILELLGAQRWTKCTLHFGANMIFLGLRGRMPWFQTSMFPSWQGIDLCSLILNSNSIGFRIRRQISGYVWRCVSRRLGVRKPHPECGWNYPGAGASNWIKWKSGEMELSTGPFTGLPAWGPHSQSCSCHDQPLHTPWPASHFTPIS